MNLIKRCKNENCKKRVYKDGICIECYGIKQQLNQNKILYDIAKILIEIKNIHYSQSKVIINDVTKKSSTTKSELFIPTFEQHESNRSNIINNEITNTTISATDLKDTIEKLEIITKGI